MKKHVILILSLLIVFLAFSVSGGSEDPLVAFWGFNEGSGTTAFDSTGHGIDGVLQNDGVTWTTDSISGNALHFDGLTGYVITPSTTFLEFNEQVRLEVWIKRESLTDGTVLGPGTPYALRVFNNKAAAGIFVDTSWAYTYGTTFLELNRWYHLVLTYDGLDVKLYVDDILEDSQSRVGVMNVNEGTSKWIGYGRFGINQYFHGIIDEVKLYNRANPIPEICDNGIDDNGDSLIDCQDPECSSFPACIPYPEICDNTIDDDLDYLTDCDDFDDCGSFCFNALQQKVDELENRTSTLERVVRIIINKGKCVIFGRCE